MGETGKAGGGKAKGATDGNDRDARLKAALKANLRRRKQASAATSSEQSQCDPPQAGETEGQSRQNG